MLFTYSHGKKWPITGKILFMGDSITDMGMYVSYLQAYLDLFQPGNGLMLYNLGLGAETVCGLTEPGHPFPRPNVNERIDRAMLTVEPHWVFVMYGMNDGIYYPFGEDRFAAYKEGMWKLIRRLKEYGCHIIVMTPTPFEPAANPNGLQEDGAEVYSFDTASVHYDEVLKRYGQFLLEEVAPEVDKVIDVHAALEGGIYTEDRVHPGWAGHYRIAQAILREFFTVCVERLDEAIPDELLQRVYRRDQLLHQFYLEVVGFIRPEHYEIDTYDRTMMKYQGLNRKVAEYIDEHPDMFEPTVSDWHGHRREDFYYRGYEGVVVVPKDKANGGWIWRTEFFEGPSAADIEMVDRGFHLVYYRVSNQYGAPSVLPYMESFYHYVREQYGLAQQMIPFGFSRGGLYAMLLCEAHPSWIRAMYLDAPVVNILSWPKMDNEHDWEECLAAWELTEENAEEKFLPTLKDRVETMAITQVPLMLVYGDSDTVVPYEDNGRLLERAYKEQEAPCKIIGKPGCGHHPHSLDDPEPIVSFLTQTEDNGAPLSSYVNLRGLNKI